MYAPVSDNVRERSCSVTINAQVPLLNECYKALDELLLSAMKAHGDSMQSIHGDPQSASASAMEPMDTGSITSALVSAGTVDSSPCQTASVSVVHMGNTTEKTNADTGDSSNKTSSSVSHDSLQALNCKVKALSQTVSTLVPEWVLHDGKCETQFMRSVKDKWCTRRPPSLQQWKICEQDE